MVSPAARAICCRAWRIASRRGPRGRAAAGRGTSGAFFLLPDGVSYHGHAVSGGKKTGSGPLALKRELRELTSEVQMKQRAVERTDDRARSNWIARSPDSVTTWRACGRLQQSQEKEALALDHEQRQAGRRILARPSRLSVARLELDRLRQEARPRPRTAGAQPALLDEKEAARSVQEQVLEQSRADFEELQVEAHEARRRARANCAPIWPGFEERAAPEQRRAGAA